MYLRVNLKHMAFTNGYPSRRLCSFMSTAVVLLLSQEALSPRPANRTPIHLSKNQLSLNCVMP